MYFSDVNLQNNWKQVMKILIDHNNLLAIENKNISQNKEFTQIVSGFKFSDFDKWMIVYHKKQFKIVNLKDLWDKMWVIMVGEHDDEYDDMELDIESMESALKLFDWFNEESGEKYFFLYKYGENKMVELNEKLIKLGSKIQLSKSENGITTSYSDKELVFNPISFLFGLVLVYGTFQIKDWDLRAIKTQIPLFGQYMDKQDIIDEILDVLAENGLYVNRNIQDTNDGIIYEITSSDYELLDFFANFYEPIEKWLKISKYSEVQNIKQDLIKFIETNPEIPTLWKKEVLATLENWIIKILVK